ncbi:hypothetical protein KC332_g4847 [Hortaea werneckii]|uniref:RING-type domain-containing protein n=2 Tax=Hortaea werneckii TaxID=91943 RepID=A0A3M7J763_HORWE|nr:hypothetical protein KC358_g4559 [Hortaea werneckii]OTA36150.1 hypothetical protein BTJ68_03420 [Hortaea werneckii EXF-2000]KAI6847545.1 hypothetical protein KC350_g3420 [Hortaea werneckii]KAI6937008.1 hypothetical protein KC341_g5870 [Hortaea werneckii]KAI6941091.1 hypothetical protein KC348_g4791 [Hortaea werneckii]
MATHDEHQPPPTPRCVVCEDTDDEYPLIHACRVCRSDYCLLCLSEMFNGAATDNGRMPPRCCTLLQIHTALPLLNAQEADTYRLKLEEFLTPDKVYCPAPTCSAFISPRFIPAVPTSSPSSPRPVSQQKILADIVKGVVAHPAARFFRGEVDITQAPGYTAVVAKHIDLSSITNHLSNYASAKELTADMKLIVKNAKAYNGPEHPISKTAEELFDVYLEQIYAVLDKAGQADNSTAQSFFPCPKCHVAICTKCKQIEHGVLPCDTTKRDEELAMLKQFGIKQCPNCKQAIRKMFGCSHIQCRCGAHFCYYCQLSVRDCDGSCDRYDEEFSGQDSDATTGAEESQESQMQPQQQQQAKGHEDADINADIQVARKGLAANPIANQPIEAVPAKGSNGDPSHGLQSQHRDQHNSTGSETAPVNLDAGGSVRWANSGLDFGDEPDENHAYDQIWSCLHDFMEYLSHEDGFNHGREDLMECNRCFQRVAPAKRPETHIGQFKINTRTVEDRIIKVDNQAWECLMCGLVTCTRCMDIFEGRV